MQAEAFEVCARWELSPCMDKAEGGMESVESEWEGSENFAAVVDAAVENEAMLGMVGESTERRQEAGVPLQWGMPAGQTDGRYSRADLRR